MERVIIDIGSGNIKSYTVDENKKVTVVFQKYEIAPGYMGIQSFEIANEILI